MDERSARVELVDNFLDLFYRKSLGEKTIAENKELIRTVDQLYQTGEDSTANNYLLSLFLLDLQSREKFIEQNWSGKKVLVRLKRSSSEFESEVRRFECLLSSFCCLRFDDLVRSKKKTNLKLIVEYLLEDIKSSLVELRFTAVLALQSINKAVLRLVVHRIKVKRPKISPAFSENDLNKLVEFVADLINDHLFDRMQDSNDEIRQFFYETLIDLIDVWPNQWISKSLMNHWIYSIVSQENKIDVNKSIRCWQSLLSNKDLDRSSVKSSVEHLLVRLSSMKFELISKTNVNLVLKLVDDCLRIYPELATQQTIVRFSSAIVDENLSTQRLSWNLFVHWFESTRRFDESFWSRLVDLLVVLFENSINEQIIQSIVDSMDKNFNVRPILFEFDSIEALIEQELFDESKKSVEARKRTVVILSRCLFIVHSNRTTDDDRPSNRLAQILFELVVRMLAKEPIDESLLGESLLCLRAISTSIKKNFVESNREATVTLLNDLHLVRTTKRLARANIEPN